MGIYIIIKNKKDTKFHKEEKMFNSFNHFSSSFEFFFKDSSVIAKAIKMFKVF